MLAAKTLNLDLIHTPGEHYFVYASTVGKVEGMVMVPENYEPSLFAVLGHPHSLQGGSMSNKVVTTMARAFRDLNIRSIRFNFRGVGHTEGEFDHGLGESEDTLTLMHTLKTFDESLTFILAGFSFGSYVTHRAACQLKPAWLLSVAPPIERYDYETDPMCPWAIFQGDADEIVNAEGVFNFVKSYPRPLELVKFENTGHFFHGQLLKLRETVILCHKKFI